MPVCVRIIGMLTRTKVTLCLRSCEFVVACKDACVGAIRTSGSVANYVLHFVGCMCNDRVLLFQFSFVLRSLSCAVCAYIYALCSLCSLCGLHESTCSCHVLAHSGVAVKLSDCFVGSMPNTLTFCIIVLNIQVRQMFSSRCFGDSRACNRVSGGSEWVGQSWWIS